jgi:hypothetical protein
MAGEAVGDANNWVTFAYDDAQAGAGAVLMLRSKS